MHAVRRDPPRLSWWKRVTSRLYYRLFVFLSGVQIEPGAADFRLLDRQVLDEILQFEEEIIPRLHVQRFAECGRDNDSAAFRHSDCFDVLGHKGSIGHIEEHGQIRTR